MSRKNAKSSAKPKPKNASKIQMTPLKLEKDLMSTPAQLATQFAKEISTLKQIDSKLQSAVTKTKMQMQKSATGAKAKAAMKLLKELTKQLTDNTRSLEMMLNKQSKMIALRKVLGQFDKDWAKKSKANKTKSASKSKKSKKTAQKTMSSASIIPLEQSQVESCDSSCAFDQAIRSHE